MLDKKLESQISKISVKNKEDNENKAGEKIIVKENIEVGKVFNIILLIGLSRAQIKWKLLDWKNFWRFIMIEYFSVYIKVGLYVKTLFLDFSVFWYFLDRLESSSCKKVNKFWSALIGKNFERSIFSKMGQN